MLISIQAADLSDVPVNVKRQSSNQFDHNRMVMHNLAEAYFHLTGKRPTRSASSKKSKSFTDFVRDMLEATSIQISSVDNAVKCECALW